MTTKIKETTYNLASKLAALADKHKVKGRKPITAYRTQAEMTLAQAAPVAAAIQVEMLTGGMPTDSDLFNACEKVLDRICGRARQAVDLSVPRKIVIEVKRDGG
ncbi:hypothetical protein ACFLXA_02720 [Chloroflexota bacterium]